MNYWEKHTFNSKKNNFYGNNKEALNQFNKKNSIDQTIFTWPRHADGTCDYDGSTKTAAIQLSQDLTSQKVSLNKTMTVNENLKLRSGRCKGPRW